MEISQRPYSPPSPLELHYSDAASTTFPDRPIRPLPRRRIRSKISPELAESILHSSPSEPTEKLFQIPYFEASTQNGRSTSQSSSLEAQASDSIDDDQKVQTHLRARLEHGAEGLERATDGRKEQLLWPPSLGTAPAWSSHVKPRNDSSRHSKQNASQSIASSADSVDGYDSFENTNNKKKRKIPANGGHHSSLSAEMASMGITPTRDIDASHTDSDSGIGHYYGSGSSALPTKPGANVSGAGRGRYSKIGGRRRSTRSPLGVSFNGSNNARRGPPNAEDSLAKEALPTADTDQGIISAAIANAATLPIGNAEQENLSPLSQQSTRAHSQGKTQFTFTCESDSTNDMVWPGYGYPSTPGAYPEGLANGVDGAYEQGAMQHASQTNSGIGNEAAQARGGSSQTAKAPKPRRPLSKQYTMAARDRQLRQNYNNYHHPPKEEDVWICEYCEYEAIFGGPPEALLRQYEVKDRRERRRLAEKRRLLEKAKMKGRKGKRGNKNSKSTANAPQHQQANQKQRYDPQATDDYGADPGGLQSDDYVLDHYDEDATPNMPPQAPSRFSQSAAQTITQNQRLSDINADWVHDKYEDDPHAVQLGYLTMMDLKIHVVDVALPNRRGKILELYNERSLRNDVCRTISDSRLRVDNLHYDLTEDDLEDLFTRIAPITSLSLVYDRAGRSTGTAYVSYDSIGAANRAIREFDGANAAGQPIRLTLLPTAPATEFHRGRDTVASRNPFDTATRPGRSLFDRIEKPNGRRPDGRNRSRSPDLPRRSNVAKPPPDGVDRYVPGERSGGRRRSRSRSPPRRRRSPPGRGRSPARRGRGKPKVDGEGRQLVGGRPRKTQEELDREMEDYWEKKKENTASEQNGKAQAIQSIAVPEDEDIDMIT
ncbi:uncharacterized protein KY384_000627 [Bacidia gigantensis]|uniref:uncharacterized protein n=1 Tax=Bacidia gigantensis TaxID=2732470 RepID=UPI001D045550|nr:uncharacterized protein KY384_000627 [Bacidia gigantensis]KAG8525867.1 hypothetical protein KY384_000627 [Bacidia gigantensis]